MELSLFHYLPAFDIFKTLIYIYLLMATMSVDLDNFFCAFRQDIYCLVKILTFK